MLKNLGLSLFGTILVLLVLGETAGGDGFFMNKWFISLLFIGGFASLEYYGHWKSKSGWQRDDNVFNLDFYRKERKKRVREKKPLKKKVSDIRVDGSAWETIYSDTDQAKVELMNSLLKNHDIACHIGNRQAASIIPTIGGLSFNLMVKKDQVSQALGILKKHNLYQS